MRCFQFYAYDADGRVVSETRTTSGVSTYSTYTYDETGNLTLAWSNTGRYTMTYDSLDRASTQRGPFGLILTYSYDAEGRITRRDDNRGGVTSYVFDALGRRTSIYLFGTAAASLQEDRAYDARGALTTVTRFNNTNGTTWLCRIKFRSHMLPN